MSVTELSLADLLVALSHEDNHYDAWNELLRRDEVRDARIATLESQLADAKLHTLEAAVRAVRDGDEGRGGDERGVDMEFRPLDELYGLVPEVGS